MTSYCGLSRAIEEGVQGVAEVLADGLRVAPPQERVRLVDEQEQALAARLETGRQASRHGPAGRDMDLV